MKLSKALLRPLPLGYKSKSRLEICFFTALGFPIYFLEDTEKAENRFKKW